MRVCLCCKEEEIEYKFIMKSFIQSNQSILKYSLLLMIIIPFFGLNLFLNFIGNILLVLFLIPLLLLIVAIIGFSSIKSKVSTCSHCGTLSLGNSKTCINCGADLDNTNFNENQIFKNPSERTIDVNAEEIK